MAPDDPPPTHGVTDSAGQTRGIALRLYVAGATTASSTAIATIQEICAERLSTPHDLQVFDVYQMPEDARRENIVVTPTLVISAGDHTERLTGDFSDRERVIGLSGGVP
jgi:ribosomal protein L18E